MTGRTADGSALTPGVNVDPIDFIAGQEAAEKWGYCKNEHDKMVVGYALRRWSRGEEEGADQTWMSHFGRQSFSDWRAILAHAIAQGTANLQAYRPKHRAEGPAL